MYCPFKIRGDKRDSSSLWELGRTVSADPNRFLIPPTKKNGGKRVFCKANPINATLQFYAAFFNGPDVKDHPLCSRILLHSQNQTY